MNAQEKTGDRLDKMNRAHASVATSMPLTFTYDTNDSYHRKEHFYACRDRNGRIVGDMGF